jgi:DNA-binding NarL/FixJ family response regulator
MTIALFDDHPIILSALSNFLAQKKDVEIAGAVSTKSEVLSLLQSQQIHILISDVLTDESLGLELFEEIHAGNFETKVVVYSSLQGELVHNFLYEYGVAAIVSKTNGLDELWKVVTNTYITTEYTKHNKGPLPPALTSKEKEIVKYLTRGMAAKEIALLTQNSVNTINNQKNHLLTKFDCANTSELVLKLAQIGYINF